jgi:D-amino-acid dehydrogenase
MSGSVVIIGGGIVGLCSAFYLSEWGWKVTVLERGSLDDLGASHGNCGFIVPSHFVPLASPGTFKLGMKLMWNPSGPLGMKWSSELLKWNLKFMKSATAAHVERVGPLILDLNLESKRLYQVMGKDLGWEDMPKNRGMLMVASKQSTVEELHHMVEQGVKYGLTAEKLDEMGIARHAKGVEVRSPGGCYFDCDADLNPSVVMRRLGGFLRAQGVEIVENCEVTEIRKNGHHITRVLAGDREFSADEFVVAAGVWSGQMVEDLRIDLPMMPGKGQHLTLENVPVEPSLPMLLEDARVAVTPLGGGSVRFGGTMELGAWSEKLNQRRLGGMKRAIGQVLPQFKGQFDGAKTWAGLRPCLPDGLPAVGRAGGYLNLFLATGHAMMGMSLGPITGLAVAESLSGVKLTVPIHALSPDRFKK